MIGALLLILFGAILGIAALGVALVSMSFHITVFYSAAADAKFPVSLTALSAGNFR